MSAIVERGEESSTAQPTVGGPGRDNDPVHGGVIIGENSQDRASDLG